MIRYLVIGMLLLSGSQLAYGQQSGMYTDSTRHNFSASHLSRLEQFKLPLENNLLLSKSFQIPQVVPFHFGAICRWEDMGNQDHKMPMKFRLGSLSYVNQLEQHYLVKWEPGESQSFQPAKGKN